MRNIIRNTIRPIGISLLMLAAGLGLAAHTEADELGLVGTTITIVRGCNTEAAAQAVAEAAEANDMEGAVAILKSPECFILRSTSNGRVLPMPCLITEVAADERIYVISKMTSRVVRCMLLSGDPDNWIYMETDEGTPA